VLAVSIRMGKPIPTFCGALVGGALGTSSGLVMLELVPATVLLGALTGTFLAAVLFKRSPSILGARATDIDPFHVGAILETWSFETEQFKSLTVLLEQALYVVREDGAPWKQVLQKLAQGEDPDLPLGDLIRLDELERVEMRSPDATEIQIVHSAAGRTKRRGVDFRTTGERDELIAALERYFGKPFSRRECPLDFACSIRVPVVSAVVAGMLFLSVAWLSAHWTAQPLRRREVRRNKTILSVC
jgi:hypothetical protein